MSKNVTIGRYRRGPDDLSWSIMLTMPDGSKVGPLSAGKPGKTEVEASFAAVAAYYERKTLFERGVDPKRRMSVPAASASPSRPVFADAAAIAIESLRELRRETLRLEGEGKAQKYSVRLARIERHLLPALGDTPWTEMRAKANEWLPTYRKTGGGIPSQGTIGGLNDALQTCNAIAASKGWLTDDKLFWPKLSKTGVLGAKPAERGEEFDLEEIQAISRIMTDDWAAKSATRRLLRAYIALMASSGIRSGEELKATRESAIQIIPEQGIYVTVVSRAGKYTASRVAVCRGHTGFKIRTILTDLFDWRKREWKVSGKTPAASSIFLNPNTGRFPLYHEIFREFLAEHGLRASPVTGKNRTGYSFRHAAITQALMDGVEIHTIAQVHGTSVEMIERFYSHMTGMRAAKLVTGTRAALEFGTIKLD